MTCIVGVRTDEGVWIGADSVASTTSTLTARADPKLFRREPYVIGFTSSYRMGQLLRFSPSLPYPPPDLVSEDLYPWMVTEFVEWVRVVLRDGGFSRKENEVEEGGQFLDGVSGRLFFVGSDFQVGESADGYDVCGCGERLALGSLHTSRGAPPADRVVRALEAAEHHDPAVRAPFLVEYVARGTA